MQIILLLPEKVNKPVSKERIIPLASDDVLEYIQCQGQIGW